jgi:hypothetical protein
VHVVAENNNDAGQLKLTSHLEADVPASEAGVSDLGRHARTEFSLAVPVLVLVLKFMYGLFQWLVP